MVAGIGYILALLQQYGTLGGLVGEYFTTMISGTWNDEEEEEEEAKEEGRRHLGDVVDADFENDAIAVGGQNLCFLHLHLHLHPPQSPSNHH